MARDLTHWSISKLLLTAASVFAVAAITALLLTLLNSGITGLPSLADLMRPKSISPTTALSSEDKLAILAGLSEKTASTTLSEPEKANIMEKLRASKGSPVIELTVEEKLQILADMQKSTGL